jgi:hypothetical protein
LGGLDLFLQRLDLIAGVVKIGRARSRSASKVRGSISNSRSPALTNWLSPTGSLISGPDTRGVI